MTRLVGVEKKRRLAEAVCARFKAWVRRKASGGERRTGASGPGEREQATANRCCKSALCCRRRHAGRFAKMHSWRRLQALNTRAARDQPHDGRLAAGKLLRSHRGRLKTNKFRSAVRPGLRAATAMTSAGSRKNRVCALQSSAPATNEWQRRAAATLLNSSPDPLLC